MKNMLPLIVKFEPVGDLWIASAPELDLMTQGESFEKAQENLQESLLLFFESCLRRGTLEQVLAEAGLKPLRRKAVEQAAPAFVAQFLPPSTVCHA
jgi:predicted RNase H-like HicB family nuclease